MTMMALIVGLALLPQTIEKPTVQYYQQTFIIRQGEEVLRIPFSAPKPKTPLFTAFRKNDTFVVWDDRGLTIRSHSDVSSSRLSAIVASPKAFSKAEIQQTVRQNKEGKKSREASAISGARRIGKDVFFLVRWDDVSGKPWTEVLVSVNLSSSKPTVEIAGRFEALSMGTRSIDDKLQIVEGKLAVVCHNKDSWGLSTFDPVTRQFNYHPMGGTLVSYDTLNPIQGLFVETSSYGTTIAGRVDLVSGTRKILYEGHQQMRFLDLVDPLVVLASMGNKTKLVNCATGVIREMPFVLEGRRASNNILFWTPSSSPNAVWLLDPNTWEAEARWRAN